MIESRERSRGSSEQTAQIAPKYISERNATLLLTGLTSPPENMSKRPAAYRNSSKKANLNLGLHLC